MALKNILSMLEFIKLLNREDFARVLAVCGVLLSTVTAGNSRLLHYPQRKQKLSDQSVFRASVSCLSYPLFITGRIRHLQNRLLQV